MTAQVCVYCQTGGTADRPLRPVGDKDAASGPGTSFSAHDDCPSPEQMRPGNRRSALAEAIRRATHGHGCAS